MSAHTAPEPPYDESTDELEFTVRTRFGSELRQWDDGFGPLWLYSESLGPMGVVRARNWYEAYECCQDEIMHGCTWDELEPENRQYFETDGRKGWADGIGYRSNGEPSNDGIHGEFYCEDPNGSALELLSPELAERLGLTVEWSEPDE